VLWKSLWNYWLRKKCLVVKIRRPSRRGGLPNPKALNSNQLGNSLGINMGGTCGKAGYSGFGDLHISRFLTFEFRVSERGKTIVGNGQKPLGIATVSVVVNRQRRRVVGQFPKQERMNTKGTKAHEENTETKSLRDTLCPRWLVSPLFAL
jgi:hypothetical protein